MGRGIYTLWAVLVLGSLAAALQAADSPKLSPPPKPPAKQEDDDYELQRLLVDTLDQVQRNYVREISRRKLIEAAIKGVLAELDPYSSYVSPEEMDLFRTVVESEFGGIGVQIDVDHGQLRVLSPLPGTPAYRAGLMAGDRILEIDGKSTENITMDDASRRIKGKPGTQVTLTVIHPGRTVAEVVRVTRASIHVETVLGDHRHADDTWDFMVDPQHRIGYVRISGFGRDTAEELQRALAAIQKEKMRGLIVDLRFNTGGLLTTAVEVADLFIAEGRIVSTAGRNSPEQVWNARKPGTFEGFPMAVLVNRYSASASEIVAACLQDHKRAVIVGERTWGKGSVQKVIPLESLRGEGEATRPDHRSALKLTTAGYRRPNGRNIDRTPGAKESDDWGVTPDKGLDLRLDDREMLALIADRRHRDIVAPKQPVLAAAAAPAAQGPAKPGSAKPDAPPPAPDAAKEPAPSAQKPPGPAPQPTGLVDRQLKMALDHLAAELARSR